MVGKRVLPVLHLQDEKQVREQARLVYESGADGLFLIDMGDSLIDTRHAARIVREDWPDRWLGVNVLGWNTVGAILNVIDWPIQGLWVDHTGITDNVRSWGVMPLIRSHLFNWEVLAGEPLELFGGVAFKYGPEVPKEHLEQLARAAATVLPVVCTSGPGTGQAADLEKLALMRRGVDGSNARLAVASGVCPENASDQFAYVDDVLLATGIERAFGYFDPARLAAVIKAAR